MRILFVSPNWIGDAVMSLGLIQALHQHCNLQGSESKACEIHVLASQVTAPVYQFSHAVRMVHTEAFVHGKLQLGLRRRVGHLLKARHFDIAFVLPNSLKSAFIPWFAGIPKRVGYQGEFRAFLLTHALPKPSKKNRPPMLQWYGQLGGFSGAELPNPVLNVSEGLISAACQAFQLESGFLAIAPGAEYGPAKQWPAAHCAQVVKFFLIANPLQHAVLLGGHNDQAFCAQIADLIPDYLRVRVRTLAGKTSLAQAIALVASASQLLTNDSGLMHVAAALNVQVHAVFGSTSPHHTPPLNSKAKVYYLDLACSPCFQRNCPLGHMDCLNKLEPKMVIEHLAPSSLGV